MQKKPNPKQSEAVIQTKRTQKALAHRPWLIKEIEKFQSKLPQKEAFEKNWAHTEEGEDTKKSKENLDTMVCVRQRPLLEREKQDEKVFTANVVNHPKVHFFDIKESVTKVPTFQPQTYNVDFAFGPEDSNEVVYDCVGQNVVNIALNQGIGIFLAFGQTGSGKTYTLTGILDGVAQDLFKLQKSTKKVFVQYIELSYIEVDLLNNRKRVEIKSYPGLSEQIKGAVEYEVTSAEEVHQKIDAAQKIRLSAPTYKNDCSSRSVAFLKFRIEDQELKEKDPKNYKDGELSIIDMPGSEFEADRQFHTKEEEMQSMMINFALIELKRCLIMKAEARKNPHKKVHVNQSSWCLMRLLRDVLDPFPKRKSSLVFFANISPSVIDLAQSKNTLDYCYPIKVGGGGPVGSTPAKKKSVSGTSTTTKKAGKK